MKRIVFLTCALLLMTAGGARAQQHDQDAIAQNFFAPDLVIQHQEAIGLSDDQKAYLKSEIRQAQGKFTEWQWKLQDEMEKLESLTKQPTVNEQEVLAQLETVLSTEREMKRAQITLLVHIKNKLTPEQQARLAQIRNETTNK
jgi:Spy/CpxP family protein refolding chaperone